MNNKNKYLPIVVHGIICTYCHRFRDESFYTIDNVNYDHCIDCHKKVKYRERYHKYKDTKKYKSYIKSYDCECGLTLKSGQKANIKKHLLSQRHVDIMNEKHIIL
jgi:hypothetical protein